MSQGWAAPEKKSSWELTGDEEKALEHYPDQDVSELIEWVYSLEDQFKVEFREFY